MRLTAAKLLNSERGSGCFFGILETEFSESWQLALDKSEGVVKEHLSWTGGCPFIRVLCE
jgi:hypothetical protein